MTELETALKNHDWSLDGYQVHTRKAGNIVTLASAANAISLGAPTYSDNGGMVMLNLPYTLVPSTSGNDEFTLAYT